MDRRETIASIDMASSFKEKLETSPRSNMKEGGGRRSAAAGVGRSLSSNQPGTSYAEEAVVAGVVTLLLASVRSISKPSHRSIRL